MGRRPIVSLARRDALHCSKGSDATVGWKPFSQNVPMLAYTMLAEAYRPRGQGCAGSCAAHTFQPLYKKSVKASVTIILPVLLVDGGALKKRGSARIVHARGAAWLVFGFNGAQRDRAANLLCAGHKAAAQLAIPSATDTRACGWITLVTQVTNLIKCCLLLWQ